MKSNFVSLTLLSIFVVFAAAEIATRWDEEVWKDIPGQNYARFYIFNVTNANKFNYSSILEKPIVKEVGPYVYIMKREKFNVSEVYEDGSFYFRERKTYQFQPQLSNGRSEDDVVNVINSALITYANRGVRTDHYMFSMYFENILKNEGEELILKNQKVSDVLLNGRNASIYVKYEKYIIESSGNEGVPPGFEDFEDGRYGLFKGASGRNNGLFRVRQRSSGSNIGQIISLNDETQLKIWNGSECNKLSGTDGSVFSLGISSDTLDVFLPEISRSAPLVKTGSTELGGVRGNRYHFSNSFLEDLELAPENKCFCTDFYSRCMKRGALDLQATQRGAPYVLTYPHFIKSDGTYATFVDGLLPAPANQESFFDIEPKTGAVLESKKRFQWNVRLGPIYFGWENLTYFRKMPEYLFPLVWVEESFQLDGDIIATLKKELDGNGGEEPTTTTTLTTTAASITTPTTTTTTEGPESEPTPECSKRFDDIYISERFNSLNVQLVFLTFLVGLCLAILAFCVAFLLINANARVAKRDNNARRYEIPIQTIESKFPAANGKD